MLGTRARTRLGHLAQIKGGEQPLHARQQLGARVLRSQVDLTPHLGHGDAIPALQESLETEELAFAPVLVPAVPGGPRDTIELPRACALKTDDAWRFVPALAPQPPAPNATCLTPSARPNLCRRSHAQPRAPASTLLAISVSSFDLLVGEMVIILVSFRDLDERRSQLVLPLLRQLFQTLNHILKQFRHSADYIK
jgi:hypothetical protein